MCGMSNEANNGGEMMKEYTLTDVDTGCIAAVQIMTAVEAADRNASLRLLGERCRWVADDGTHTL